MSKRFSVYDSKEVSCIVGAIPIEDGRADPFVEVSQVGPAYEDEIGPDGSVVRYATGERRYDVTVNLMGSSEENAKLSALHAADVNATNGAGVGAFLLKDSNGSTLLAGAQCWITQTPGASKGRGPGEVSWNIRVIADATSMIVGGN